MIPIKEATEVDKLKRALRVIEGLTFVNGEDILMPNSPIDEIREKYVELVHELYCITHYALDECKGCKGRNTLGGPELIEKLEKQLAESGIIG